MVHRARAASPFGAGLQFTPADGDLGRADAGATIDPSHAVTSSQQQYCWLIRSGNDLYLAAQRSGATGTTLDVYHNQTILYPTAPPLGGTGPTSAAALEAAGSNQNVNLTALRAAEAGTAQTWTVLAGGTLATLTIPASAVVWLPADADAPSFGETATIAAATAEVQASAETLGPTSTLSLSEPLTYLYDASTVQVNLNVVPAAAGQVVSVPIGSGDPQQAHQSFKIANPVAAIGTPNAPTAAPQTSLNVYVDGSPWTRVSSLTQAGPTDDVYVQSQNADGSVTISFGDGNHGALLPAGTNNVFATYLKGGGPDTEVAPGAVLQALDRPQLVTAVHIGNLDKDVHESVAEAVELKFLHRVCFPLEGTDQPETRAKRAGPAAKVSNSIVCTHGAGPTAVSRAPHDSGAEQDPYNSGR